MNWYKKAVNGEFWLIGNQATYADGDIGDMNHEAIVREHILSQYDLEYEDYEGMTREQLLEKGVTEEEMNVMSGRTDAREYGLKHLGWIRVKKNVSEVYGLTSRTLKQLANGLYDAFQDEVEDTLFEIEDLKSHKFFSDIPWEVINSEDLSGLMRYQYKYQAPG